MDNSGSWTGEGGGGVEKSQEQSLGSEERPGTSVGQDGSKEEDQQSGEACTSNGFQCLD